MKPFLGIDITENKRNKQLNGDEFIVASPSPELTKALENAIKEQSGEISSYIWASESNLESLKHNWFVIIGMFLVLLFLYGVANVLGAGEELAPAKLYRQAPWLFWIVGGLLVVEMIITIISYYREGKGVGVKMETDSASSKLDAIYDAIEAELGVPSKAPDVDILSFPYHLEDGLPVARQRKSHQDTCDNFEYKIHIDDGQLFLTNLEHKYAFPLSEMQTIRTVHKDISMLAWNKEMDFDRGIYKKYQMYMDRYENIHIKPYHILELEHNGERWGIYFPCYELPIFQKLTGLSAE